MKLSKKTMNQERNRVLIVMRGDSCTGRPQRRGTDRNDVQLQAVWGDIACCLRQSKGPIPISLWSASSALTYRCLGVPEMNDIFNVHLNHGFPFDKSDWGPDMGKGKGSLWRGGTEFQLLHPQPQPCPLCLGISLELGRRATFPAVTKEKNDNKCLQECERRGTLVHG